MTIENTDEYKEWLREIQQDGYALQDVPNALKTEALCLVAAQEDGRALQYVPETLKTEALCLAAVQQNGHALLFVPDALKTKVFCLKAVQQDGYALRYVPETLKTEALCLAAVQQDGYALRYVPDVLKTEEICRTAVHQWGRSLKFVIQPTNQLVTDPEQLARWNRILLQADETNQRSKDYLQTQLITPLLAQANAVQKLTAPVVDEIATLIEHCERLKINIEPIKALYCEKQQLAKPQSKHKKCASSEHTL